MSNTPTDDEREALANLRERIAFNASTHGDDAWWRGHVQGMKDAVDEVERAGFRRTVVPEPGIEECTCVCHSTPGPHERHRCSPSPQGEPSDDYEAGYAEGFHHGVSSPRGSAEDDREQVEPSDALRDAIDHIQGAVEFQDAINPEAVRVVIDAALRAASSVTEQGENQ